MSIGGSGVLSARAPSGLHGRDFHQATIKAGRRPPGSTPRRSRPVPWSSGNIHKPELPISLNAHLNADNGTKLTYLVTKKKIFNTLKILALISGKYLT
ncbi:MAG: hypothetical protein K8I00_00405, partial [Candidatus Omnitrophica bacterium]|nr:hypothetical protein [Candidatus Omnitrophota bacterium]